MTTQMNTATGPMLRLGNDFVEQLRELADEARVMWRREPAGLGPLRTRIMRDLAAVRLDLEALERRSSRGEPDVEHERELHDCASRVERLRLHWRAAGA